MDDRGQALGFWIGHQLERLPHDEGAELRQVLAHFERQLVVVADHGVEEHGPQPPIIEQRLVQAGPLVVPGIMDRLQLRGRFEKERGFELAGICGFFGDLRISLAGVVHCDFPLRIRCVFGFKVLYAMPVNIGLFMRAALATTSPKRKRRGAAPPPLPCAACSEEFYGNSLSTDWFAWLAMDSAEISSCCRVCSVSRLALSWF